jgi:hypothetical protein
MQAKNVLYAAVGAPVVVARKVGNQVSAIKDRVTEETASYTKVANEAIDGWAVEGEKVVAGIRDGKVVEEISQKVDLDQAKEQVSKLRDQLEDMLATWRQSFRPEKVNGTGAEKVEETSATKPVTKKPAARSTASKPATKTSAAKTTKSSPATKTSSAKSTPANSGTKSSS